MKGCKIVNFLRLATPSDLFTDNGNGELNEFVPVFYKSLTTNNFEGPYYLCKTGSNIVELWAQIQLKMIYVLNHVEDENTIPFSFVIRQSLTIDDFLYVGTPKSNFIFYLFTTTVSGPFYICNNTNWIQLKKDIEAGIVFIVAKKQSFQLLIRKQTA